MNKKIFLIIVLFLLIIPSVLGIEKHTKLLAVSENNKTYVGEVVDLFLEMKPGTGKVFIVTIPFSKVDTQMSTRIANRIACEYAEKDCSKYDFFYTIRSDSVLVGGPSAGAAISVITVAGLNDYKLDPFTSITGTISSGEIIGPVSGIKEKIEAAEKNDLEKVLIPAGIDVLLYKENGEEKNITLEEFKEQINVSVVSVGFLDEAISEFTGKEFSEEDYDFEINQEYLDKMKEISDMLCNNSLELKKKAIKLDINLTNETEMLIENSENAYDNEKYYASASYCFNFNNEVSWLIYEERNLSLSEIKKMENKLLNNVDELREKIKLEDTTTLSSLETYMLVESRLEETIQIIDKMSETKNVTEKTYFLAYAENRYNSAVYWASFFDAEFQNEKIIDKEEIKEGCFNRMQEIEELKQYVSLFLNVNELESVLDLQNSLDNYYEEKNYEMCLFEASKIKAELNLIIGSLGISEDKVDEFVNRKLKSAKKTIKKQEEKKQFPIAGYSYYEYAEDFVNNEVFTSALLFCEYSIELSNLDMYLENEESHWISIVLFFRDNSLSLSTFLLGLLLGVYIGIELKHKKNKK